MNISDPGDVAAAAAGLGGFRPTEVPRLPGWTPAGQSLRPGFRPSEVPRGGVPFSPGVPRGQPVDVSEPATPLVMKWMPDGTPVYYGTQQARDLAVQGLQRVNAAFGMHSARYRSALAAAMGVFGPGYTPAQVHALVVPPRRPVTPGMAANPNAYGGVLGV